MTRTPDLTLTEIENQLMKMFSEESAECPASAEEKAFANLSSAEVIFIMTCVEKRFGIFFSLSEIAGCSALSFSELALLIKAKPGKS